LATTNEINDQELIEQVKQGNQAAFGELVRRYEMVVAATVNGMLGVGDDADDVGQNVFIRFYRAIDDFRGEAALGTYLTRIAINLSLNELKSRKRRRMFFIKTDNDETLAAIGDTHDEGEQRDTRELVHQALQELEPKFRSVVVLRMLQGYSTIETAQILKVPQGTVLSRLARAQEKLKDLLKNIIE
jgi:RNA polymerase sigma-70 factor (ECF subfamily)